MKLIRVLVYEGSEEWIKDYGRADWFSLSNPNDPVEEGKGTIKESMNLRIDSSVEIRMEVIKKESFNG